MIGFDHYACSWCYDEIEYKKTMVNRTAEDVSSFLKQKKYNYLIVDANTAFLYGQNETNTFIQKIGQSGLFSPVYNTQGMILFKVL